MMLGGHDTALRSRYRQLKSRSVFFNAIVDEIWGKLKWRRRCLLRSSPSFCSSSSPPIQSFSPPYPSPFLPPPPPILLGDLARALAAKQGWDPEAEVRIADLDEGGARVFFGQRYDFRLRVGRRALSLKFYDDVIEWRKVDGAVVELASDLTAGDVVSGLRPAVGDLELLGTARIESWQRLWSWRSDVTSFASPKCH